MASMNTRLNIEKLDRNIVQNHGGSKQVGFKQIGPGVSNDDTAVAQRQLKDKQPEEKTNMDCLTKEQEKEYQTGWMIKMGNVLDSCNQRSTYLVSRSPSSAIGFKKPIDMLGVFGSLLLACDRKQHLACELFGYREDSNEAGFAVVAVEKIYAHESLTFNNTVASMVAEKAVTTSMAITRSIHQATKGLLDKAKVNVLGMEIIRDQSGNTMRVSQSRFYNKKLVQTLLEGHSILSLEGRLSGDCDVGKNGKWSCIYAVRSQEYQMVCTRLDIASADVGYRLMILGCGGGLKANLQDMEDLSTTKAGYMTFTKAWKKEIWLKGLLT
ncbi:hypothetical protein Tco_0167959 [Tanacetum coccineum]